MLKRLGNGDGYRGRGSGLVPPSPPRVKLFTCYSGPLLLTEVTPKKISKTVPSIFCANILLSVYFKNLLLLDF